MIEVENSISDLDEEERLKEFFGGDSVFEISIFYDCYEAAAILNKMLEEHKENERNNI